MTDRLQIRDCTLLRRDVKKRSRKK